MKKTFRQVSDILEIRNKKTRKIRDYELLFLQEIANQLDLNSTVLEIGSFIGKSSVCIAEILENKNSKLICLDNFSDRTIENQESIFFENIRGYDNIEVIKQDSKIFFEHNCKFFDMIFIDGNHSLDYFINDLVYSIKFSKNKLCGHDFTINYPWIIDSIHFLCERFNCVYQTKGYIWEIKDFSNIQNLSPTVLKNLLLTKIRKNKIYFI